MDNIMLSGSCASAMFFSKAILISNQNQKGVLLVKRDMKPEN
jgi:hypothetical protein